MFGTVLLALAVQVAEPEVTTKVSGLLWEYPDATVSSMVFKTCLDDAPCVIIYPDEAKQETAPEAAPGESTYGFAFPAMTIATHVAKVLACNAEAMEICSEASVAFKLVVAPADIKNLRIIK
jgi:hypothetical protein